MAKKFEMLTQYIPQLKGDKFGEWIIDRENDGTEEHPIQMPFVSYSQIVDSFIDSVYQFMESNKDMQLNRYGDILKENGLEWNYDAMSKANVSSLNSQCIIALIVGAIRAERFCDGALLNFFKEECILKWLERLNAIDAE